MSREMHTPQIAEDQLDIIEIIHEPRVETTKFTQEYMQDKRGKAITRFAINATLGTALLLAPSILESDRGVSGDVADVLQSDTVGQEVVAYFEDNEQIVRVGGAAALMSAAVSLTGLIGTRRKK